MIQLEKLCQAMYETSDAATRQHAEKVLVSFASDPNALDKCQLLFQRGTSPYTQHLAASTLTKMVTKPGSNINVQQKLDIRNYALSYLYSSQDLTAFVSHGMMQLFARITKLSWFEGAKDEWLFRHVVEDISKFLKGNMHQCVTGVQLLKVLVNEMNESESVKPLTRHRKIASSFRDTTLLNVFQLHCTLLQQAGGNGSHFENSNGNLIAAVLDLGLACLSFDFIGTSHDESGDDLCTVQVPTNWRSIFLEGTTMQLLFQLYKSLPIPICSTVLPTVLGCLVQMASVRRTLLNNSERSKFLSELLNGIKMILENPDKLSDGAIYHEFCRLLSRLKSNYQLGELVKTPCYMQCIKLIADFTVMSLRMCTFSPSSLHYLLSLWQRMASSVPYVKAQEPHLLDNFAPEITKAYLESRLEYAAIILRDGLDDPLDDVESVKQQLDQISCIARCEYEKTCDHIVTAFDKTAKHFQEMIHGDMQQLALPHSQLAWIIHIVGAVVGGRVAFASCDEHDTIDGQLVVRVLRFMDLNDQQLNTGRGFAKIEVALLSFFEQYRKIYIGDQVQKTSKVYKILSDALNITDDSVMLNVLVTKIIKNLRHWGNHEVIIQKTMALLNDLSIGYSSVRKLVKLESIQFLLKNHNSSHFQFLGVESQISDLRCRTTFYTALGHFIIVDLGEDEDKFNEFMLPFDTVLESLMQVFGSSIQNESMNTIVMKTMTGMARDLKGVISAFNTKSSYGMLFDWLYPNFTTLMQNAVQKWYLEPSVTTPILKVMGEMVLNRGQRLQFEVSSPNGILLFKEASKMICLYGSLIVNATEIPKNKIYSHKLKGISLCFTLLKQALCGNYVNFGVFRLYNDPALDDVLNMIVKLVLSVQESDLMQYPKLGASYFTLLETLAQDHMTFLTSLPTHMMHRILSSISEGLSSLNTMICTCCCATLDCMVTHLFRLLSRSSEPRRNRFNQDPHAQERNQHFLQVMTQHPDILQKMMSTVLNMIIFDDCRNQWSLSRPLLGLILLNQEYFASMQKSLCETEFVNFPSKISLIEKSFSLLMEGVENNLLTKNRDRFTQNLSLFRRDINSAMRSNTGLGLDLSQSNQMS